MHFPYYSTPQSDQLLHFYSPHRAPLNSASQHVHTFGSDAGFYTGNTSITFQYDYMYICWIGSGDNTIISITRVTISVLQSYYDQQFNLHYNLTFIYQMSKS